MNCPVDGTTLLITSREGVEIDYCPSCRGIWLDRGELDKLIDRASAEETRYTASAPVNSQQPSRPVRYDDDDDDDYKPKNDDRYRASDRPYPQGRKKKSFLGEVFDIFD